MSTFIRIIILYLEGIVTHCQVYYINKENNLNFLFLKGGIG